MSCTPSIRSEATADGDAAAEQAASPRAVAGPTARGGIDLCLAVEAAMMTTDRPISAARLAELLGAEGPKAIQQAVEQLNEVYDQSGRSFRIEQVAGGFQVLTLEPYAEVLAALHQSREQTHLSPAAMETRAIIA